jgi:glutathione-regulated potassium-efflux system ancillary protein KefC
MDPIWILVAFVLGFTVKQLGLPPLVGFLLAGFALNLMGVEGGESLDHIADLGVYLLLFSIGLKLKIKSLFQPAIWATASLHMVITVIVFGLGIFALGLLGLSLFDGLSLGASALIAFALSFSSTVFAVKILEESGSMSSSQGRIAIGILIMQDIFAVIFLTVSSGKPPSPWSLALLSLLIIPFLLKKSPLSLIITKSGHGELLVLLGVLIPFGGAFLFGLVGLKPDLGALVLGILLSGHPKAKELSNSMLSFKDLFLVGFFLTIGLSGLPDLEALGVSVLLTLIMPLKIILFLLLLTRFKLRARTSTLASLNLANYSEFGLIVGAAGIANGWIDPEWMVIFAISLSITFIIASPLNMKAESLFARWQTRLARLETNKRLQEDEPIETGDAEIIVLGMGRTGTAVFNTLSDIHGLKVLGIDQNPDAIQKHLSEDRNVVLGDVTDIEFWQRIQLSTTIRMAILATSKHAIHMQVISQLDKQQSSMKIAALSRYEDEMEELKKAGVHVVYNLYAEAGTGYAEDIAQVLSV